MTKPMKLATAKELVRSLGLVLVKRDGEYIVKISGVPIDDKRTYFTPDLEDALDTARDMADRIFRASPPDGWVKRTRHGD